VALFAASSRDAAMTAAVAKLASAAVVD